MPTMERTLANKFRVQPLKQLGETEHGRGHYEFARIEISGGVPIERDGNSMRAVQVTIDGVRLTIRLSDLNNAIFSARGVHALRFVAEPAGEGRHREKYFVYLVSSNPPTKEHGRRRRGEGYRDSLLETLGLMARNARTKPNKDMVG